MTAASSLTRDRWLGRRFGRLIVTEVRADRKALCQCDCGARLVVHRCNLPRGNTRSCGCLWREQVAGKTIHGRTGTRTYRIWVNMKTRCSNPRASNYPYYGGRGIRVCRRWRNFESFLADMAPCPSPKHTLDRINSDGDYEPSNCRWATMREQCANRASRGTRGVA